jgi:transcriptional regulator with PAS, ATPase and Fis domain
MGRVARTQSTILITGESGTGKEVVARVIHEKGPRPTEPFVAVNCAAIPETLLEGELFGYEKGAFTGATQARPGKFEAAGRGTLFLDEVGELPSGLQPKLLRALEEREVERLGGKRKIPIEARIITATNRDLKAAVENGSFREDLYFRLAVVSIEVPPLREREGDLPHLVDHFVATLAPEVGRRVERVASEVYQLLGEYSWPGNVRELRNVVERSLLLGHGPLLAPEDLPPLLEGGGQPGAGGTLPELAEAGVPLEELERRYIELMLERTGGNLTQAADILGIHRSTLHRKVGQGGTGTS